MKIEFEHYLYLDSLGLVGVLQDKREGIISLREKWIQKEGIIYHQVYDDDVLVGEYQAKTHQEEKEVYNKIKSLLKAKLL